MNETQKNDSIVDALNRLGETAVSQELAERSDALFEEKLAEQRAPWGKRTRTSRRFIRWLPMGAAAALILAAIVFALLSSGPNNIAWADVMEKFKSVNFVNVICYIRDGATNEPKQVELWMGHGGKVRIHHGTQVIFGERGKLIKCLDVKTRKESEPIEPAVALLEVFGPSGSMSLEAIIKEMGGDPSLSSPIVSQEASVEEHMTVFDINNDRTPEWARVWALNSSRLPMRIRLWDPRDGDCIDVSFSYSIEQPEEFFDSERFARKLTKGKSKPRNLLYEDMIDPGGQPLNARELFETSGGYHMPVIEDIGITEEGIVWVTATKATNRMPNGYTFYGFDELQDDLGRTYTRVSGMQRLEGDISCTLFAALDDSGLALDPRTPTELTVICREPRHVSNPKVIGKRTFKEWKKNSHWPRDLISDEDWSLQKYFRGRKFSKLKQ